MSSIINTSLPVNILISTYHPNTYTVILPTYNERANLPTMVYLIHKAFTFIVDKSNSHMFPIVDDWHIVIVDDASPDGTLEVAKQLQQHYGQKRITLAPREGKLGLGTAYVHGLKFARGEWIILMDSDFSHHPRFLADMLQVQKKTNADIVKGNRYLNGGGVHGWNLFRKLVSRGATFLAEKALGTDYSDLTGSYRLYRRTVFEALIHSVISRGYTFQVEMLIRAERMRVIDKNKNSDNKVIIKEVPITFVDRQFGESKLGGGEIVGFLQSLWMLMRTHLNTELVIINS